MNKLFLGLLAGIGFTPLISAQSPAYRLMDPYTIRWASPSRDEADSVPLGNGNTGVGLWVVQDGDLLFYLARNDAISEMHRLLKLGRIRISFSPNPFKAGQPFTQTLDIRTGTCTISAGPPSAEVKVQVFVDSNSQTVYVSGASKKPITVTAHLEDWRSERRVLGDEELASTWIYRTGIPKDRNAHNYESPDVVLRRPAEITWYHRNEHSPVPTHLQNQHVAGAASLVSDPILHRTFGATIRGKGFVSPSASVLALRTPMREWDLRISTHSAQTADVGSFLRALADQSNQAVSTRTAARRTREWWNTFWNRSWVFVDEGHSLNLPSNKHSLRFGADSDGNNVFRGVHGRLALYHRALSAKELIRLAATQPNAPAPSNDAITDFEGMRSTDPHLERGFTLEAWIKPDALGGRIFDKVTPGASDGMLFDIQGDRLRFIVGAEIYFANMPLHAGEWTHVAAVADPTSGRLSIYQNGQRVGGNEPSPTPTGFSAITQSYLLTRYQLACQQRSEFPAHFDGGIFTVAPEFAYYATDPRGKEWGPDYRFYGPSLWWQNTRFLYQLHLAEGNFDLMDSFYDFYFRHMPLFEAKAKAYYGAQGIFMNETLSLFGLPGMGDFGWDQKEYSEPYTHNIWQQALEFGSIALDRYDYSGDEAFLKKTIRWCDLALKFYDTRFAKDANGVMVINPTHAVETYWTGVTNDMPSIAGLTEITNRLLALPSRLTTPSQRQNWQRIVKAIPPLPKKTNVDGRVVPDVAARYNPERSNYEAPDLYCVYPFRLYGINRTENDIEEARRAWHGMLVPGHYCWYQTGVFAARLGLTDGARDDVLFRTGPAVKLKVSQSNPARPFRFPGYFGSPHDWCPDYDGAGNMANTLQEMLLQPGPHHQILLLPAWPPEWDVQFKLYAPGRTLVECDVRKGRLVSLKVTPPARARDIVISVPYSAIIPQ